MSSSSFIIADEIDKLMERYQGLMIKSSITYDTGIKNLSENYVVAINQARGRIQRSENREYMPVAIAELQRFIRQKTLPEKVSPVPELAQAQAPFIKKGLELRRQKAASIIAASVQYHTALQRLEKELTTNKKLVEAEAVREELISAQQLEELIEARQIKADYLASKALKSKAKKAAAPKSR